MTHYEAAFLLSPNLSDKDVEKFVGETKALLEKHGAVELLEAKVERRTLAYPVKKHTEGFYVFIEFDGPETLPENVRVELRHHEDLMRIAFVHKPPPKPEPEPAPVPEPTPEPTGTEEAPTAPETAPATEAPAPAEPPEAQKPDAETAAAGEPESAEEKPTEGENG